MMIDDDALAHARARLRAAQGRDGTPVTDRALERYADLNRFESHTDPGRVRRGPFSFDRELERQRIAKGEALIRRVAPGPFEDPNYFAMLARQAASIELAYEFMSDSRAGDRFARLLLGTAHAADVNAFAERLGTDDYTIVILNSGLVDFVYQAAKVVVAAVEWRRSTGSRVTGTYDLDAIRARLATDPAPIDRLYDTLAAYFFDGYPRATAYEEVPEEQHPPLSLTVAFAERWIIGHEYGHGLAPELGPTPAGANPSHIEEFFADSTATVATVHSAGMLDAVPPEFPLGGAIFALSSIDLLRQALSLLKTGDPDRLAAEVPTHPAPSARAREVLRSFRQYFDVSYGHQTFNLEFVVRPSAPEDHGFGAEQSERAYAFANVLRTVWPNVAERLLNDRRSGRRLHPMWD